MEEQNKEIKNDSKIANQEERIKYLKSKIEEREMDLNDSDVKAFIDELAKTPMTTSEYDDVLEQVFFTVAFSRFLCEIASEDFEVTSENNSYLYVYKKIKKEQEGNNLKAK